MRGEDTAGCRPPSRPAEARAAGAVGSAPAPVRRRRPARAIAEPALVDDGAGSGGIARAPGEQREHDRDGEARNHRTAPRRRSGWRVTHRVYGRHPERPPGAGQRDRAPAVAEPAPGARAVRTARPSASSSSPVRVHRGPGRRRASPPARPSRRRRVGLASCRASASAGSAGGWFASSLRKRVVPHSRSWPTASASISAANPFFVPLSHSRRRSSPGRDDPLAAMERFVGVLGQPPERRDRVPVRLPVDPAAAGAVEPALAARHAEARDDDARRCDLALRRRGDVSR